MPFILNILYFLKILSQSKDCNQSFLAQPFISVYIMIANVIVFRNEVSWNDQLNLYFANVCNLMFFIL